MVEGLGSQGCRGMGLHENADIPNAVIIKGLQVGFQG